MNERLKQLAEQAGMALKPRRLYDDNDPDGYLESDLDYLDNNLEATRVFFEGGLEKFAEMIVRECIAMADEFEIEVNRSGLVDRMKEHFGVEE